MTREDLETRTLLELACLVNVAGARWRQLVTEINNSGVDDLIGARCAAALRNRDTWLNMRRELESGRALMIDFLLASPAANVSDFGRDIAWHDDIRAVLNRTSCYDLCMTAIGLQHVTTPAAAEWVQQYEQYWIRHAGSHIDFVHCVLDEAAASLRRNRANPQAVTLSFPSRARLEGYLFDALVAGINLNDPEIFAAANRYLYSTPVAPPDNPAAGETNGAPETAPAAAAVPSRAQDIFVCAHGVYHHHPTWRNLYMGRLPALDALHLNQAISLVIGLLVHQYRNRDRELQPPYGLVMPTPAHVDALRDFLRAAMSEGGIDIYSAAVDAASAANIRAVAAEFDAGRQPVLRDLAATLLPPGPMPLISTPSADPASSWISPWISPEALRDVARYDLAAVNAATTATTQLAPDTAAPTITPESLAEAARTVTEDAATQATNTLPMLSPEALRDVTMCWARQSRAPVSGHRGSTTPAAAATTATTQLAPGTAVPVARAVNVLPDGYAPVRTDNQILSQSALPPRLSPATPETERAMRELMIMLFDAHMTGATFNHMPGATFNGAGPGIMRWNLNFHSTNLRLRVENIARARQYLADIERQMGAQAPTNSAPISRSHTSVEEVSAALAPGRRRLIRLTTEEPLHGDAAQVSSDSQAEIAGPESTVPV